MQYIMRIFVRDYCSFWLALSTGRYSKEHKDENTSLRKLDLFLCSYEGLRDTYSVGCVRGGSFLERCFAPPHLRTETDPLSETLCSLMFLEYQMMDKVRKLNILECYTLSSEPFRRNLTAYILRSTLGQWNTEGQKRLGT
jgi:hypothetical protein